MGDSPILAEAERPPAVPRSIGSRIGLLGAGALLAVGLALVRGASVEDEIERDSIAAPVALWIADRDGCAVYGLDEDLILARRSIISWPTAVAGRPDGGAWILRSALGSSVGPARLLRLDSEGAIRSETVLPACAGLTSLGDGSAIVLEKASEGDGRDRIVRCDEDGGVEVVYRGRSLTCVAGWKGSIGVGDAHGIVLRVSLDPVGAVIADIDLHERVLEMESDSIADHFWVLTASEHATIHRLDADLVVQWSAEAGSPATSLASHGDPDRIWLVDGSRSMVRRLGEHGVVELEKGELPIVGPSRAVRSSCGGLSIASPGCVFHLDSTGRTRPGQGGFAHLIDVDRVP